MQQQQQQQQKRQVLLLLALFLLGAGRASGLVGFRAAGGGGSARSAGGRRLRSAAADAPQPPVEEPRGYNVVLTHTTADFDSLAAGVALAMLWNDQQPEIESYVCLPRGSHPAVGHFLALHKNLFPVITIKELSDDNMGKLHKLGMVDAQRADRIGPAARLLEEAEEIHVFDHHMDKDSDVNATQLVVERVGSVTTIIVEMLEAQRLRLREAEATLFALGIHADTGSLTYEASTPRDARALAWLMEKGASQAAVSAYRHASLSPEQQNVLTNSLTNLQKTVHNGVNVGSCLIRSDGYVNGLAVVTENVLEVTDCDLVLLGVQYSQKKGRQPNNLVVIGRAKPSAGKVDLNHVLGQLGGGGHPKAASATVRLSSNETDTGEGAEAEAENILAEAVRAVCVSIRQKDRACDIMTGPVLTASPTDTLAEVDHLLERHGIRGVPVCTPGEDEVLGIISRSIIKRALASGHGDRPVKSWMARNFASCEANQTLSEVENLLVQNDAGRLPVLENGKLVGLITRTDLLRQHAFYHGMIYHNKAFSEPVDSSTRRLLANLRKKLKKFDDTI